MRAILGLKLVEFQKKWMKNKRLRLVGRDIKSLLSKQSGSIVKNLGNLVTTKNVHVCAVRLNERSFAVREVDMMLCGRGRRSLKLHNRSRLVVKLTLTQQRRYLSAGKG